MNAKFFISQMLGITREATEEVNTLFWKKMRGGELRLLGAFLALLACNKWPCAQP